MKTLFTILLIILLVPIVQAQDSTFNQVGFVGASYDEGWQGIGGVGIKTVENAFLGGDIWTLPYARLGVADYNTVSTEFALQYGIGNGFIGPIAGPNVDWENVENPVTYFTGAAGALGGYDFSSRFGLWGMYKFKFSYVEGDLFQDGWQAAGGLHVRF